MTSKKQCEQGNIMLAPSPFRQEKGLLMSVNKYLHMLEIINNLQPFFEDNYRRINVREYARLMKISAPTASLWLKEFEKSGLLRREEERNYIFYSAQRENKYFCDLARLYWFEQLEKSGLTNHIEKECVNPIIILFGSLSKAEVKADSDIDLALFTPSKKTLHFKTFETKVKRNIHLFMFKTREEIKSKELLSNILNGYVIRGTW